MSGLKEYIQPSIEIFNIRIDEPITALTDIIIALLCFFAFSKIRQLEISGKIQWYLKYYFLTLGLGAFFGGVIGHAFLYKFTANWKLISWMFSLLSVALIAHALLVLAKPLIRPGFSRFVVHVNMIVLILAAFFTIRMLEFSPVKYHSIYGLLIVVGSLSLYVFQRTGSRGAIQFLFAIGLALVAAVIFSYELGVGPWFNHKDISHVFMTGSVFFFYRGSTMVLTL